MRSSTATASSSVVSVTSTERVSLPPGEMDTLTGTSVFSIATTPVGMNVTAPTPTSTVRLSSVSPASFVVVIVALPAPTTSMLTSCCVGAPIPNVRTSESPVAPTGTATPASSVVSVT